jgi:hypothetical protein
MQLRVLTLAAAAFLAACGGGGGGGGGPVAAPVTFNLDAAVANALVTGFATGTLTATDTSGNTYTASETVQPAADGTFEGTILKQSKNTVTATKNGAFAGNATSNGFFSVNPLTIKGSTHSDGTYAVASQQTALPTAATVGQTGAFYNSTNYASSSKTSVVSTAVATWSLEADTANTAFACINTSTSFSNGSRSAEADCYKINAAGQIIGGKVTLTINGVTLSFK